MRRQKALQRHSDALKGALDFAQGGSILIVGHGATHDFVAEALCPVQHLLRHHTPYLVDHCSITEIVEKKGTWRVTKFGDTPWLTPEMAKDIAALKRQRRVEAIPKSQPRATPQVARQMPQAAPMETMKRPCVVGSWDNWEPHAMTWDKASKSYEFEVQLGSKAVENFLILSDGDWRKCLHPDCADTCPQMPCRLCGPDANGHGKSWTIGKHRDDQSGACVTHVIRLFLKPSGQADKVDCVCRGLEGQLPENPYDVAPQVAGGQPPINDTWRR